LALSLWHAPSKALFARHRKCGACRSCWRFSDFGSAVAERSADTALGRAERRDAQPVDDRRLGIG